MKHTDLYYVALGCLLFGWLVRRSRQQQLEQIDPVTRLRNAGLL